MSELEDPSRRAFNLAMKREKARQLAIKRAADICMNADPSQWDALGEAEIALQEPDVQDAFAKQIRESIKVTREVRDGLLKRKARGEEPD